jgi:DNA polymerase I-like protein with 3'-5' exonuclease and polymerase domains
LWQSKGKRSAIFKLLCNKRGVDVYEQYHRTLRELKNESRMAMKTCESRGHVKTLMGRKRNLPERFAWRAFNTVTQGSAADMIKETAVRAAPRYNAAVREAGIDIIAQVHDENLFHGPSETMRDPKIIKMLADIMEHPSIELRVPLRTSASISNKNWYTVEPIPIPR